MRLVSGSGVKRQDLRSSKVASSRSCTKRVAFTVATPSFFAFRDCGGCGLVDFGRRRDLAVAEILQDLEDFAPRGELPAAAALVEVHRLHELDLLFRVVALARR